MKKLFSLLLIGMFALTLTACDPNEDLGGTTDLKIAGVKGPELHLVGDQLLISVVFETLKVEGGLRYPIPKYPNSHIEVAPDFESDGTLMVVAVDLDDIFGGNLGHLDPQTLPGGRALPGVSSGKLPAVAFSIPQWKNVALYLGPKLFGVFFPLKLDMNGAMITAKFYADGKRQGNISLVGEDENNDNSGFLLMLNLDSATTKKLKYLANKY